MRLISRCLSRPLSDNNSGVLGYVRVEYAGIEFSPDNELNGIAFQGVGRGTVVDYIQVKFNKDDGVEFFGGTVDAKHLVLTAIGDDTIDWTFGWSGRIQFAVGQQRGDDADNGIEADNNGNNNALTPVSNPTLYNITLIGVWTPPKAARATTAARSAKAPPARSGTSSSWASRNTASTSATP